MGQMRSQQAALCQRAANRELSLFACAKAEVAAVGRIGLSPSYKHLFLEARRVLKRGCGHARVLHDMSSLLYRYMFYPWYIATFLRVTCCLVRDPKRSTSLRTGLQLFATRRAPLPSCSGRDRFEPRWDSGSRCGGVGPLRRVKPLWRVFPLRRDIPLLWKFFFSGCAVLSGIGIFTVEQSLDPSFFMPPFDSLTNQFHSFLPRGFRWHGISSISSGDRKLPSIADCGEPHSQLNLRSLDLQLTSVSSVGVGSSGLRGQSQSAIHVPSWHIFHHMVIVPIALQYIENQQLPSVDFLLLSCDSINLAQEYQGFYGVDLGVPLGHRDGLSRSFCLLVCPRERSWDWVFHIGCLLIWDTFTFICFWGWKFRTEPFELNRSYQRKKKCFEVERMSSPFGGSYIPSPRSADRPFVPDLGSFVSCLEGTSPDSASPGVSWADGSHAFLFTKATGTCVLVPKALQTDRAMSHAAWRTEIATDIQFGYQVRTSIIELWSVMQQIHSWTLQRLSFGLGGDSRTETLEAPM